MPVAFKFSREFFERLGEGVANEIVEWFNQVDVTYRADLKQFNELNFERFDAKLEQRLAEFAAKLDRRLNQLDTNWEVRLAELDSKVETRFAAFESKVEARFAAFDSKWEGRFAELDSKWEARFAELDSKWDDRFGKLDSKWEGRFAEHDGRFDALERRLAQLEVKIAETKSDLTKTVLAAWAGTVIPLTGLMIVMFNALR